MCQTSLIQTSCLALLKAIDDWENSTLGFGYRI